MKLVVRVAHFTLHALLLLAVEGYTAIDHIEKESERDENDPIAIDPAYINTRQQGSPERIQTV